MVQSKSADICSGFSPAWRASLSQSASLATRPCRVLKAYARDFVRLIALSLSAGLPAIVTAVEADPRAYAWRMGKSALVGAGTDACGTASETGVLTLSGVPPP